MRWSGDPFNWDISQSRTSPNGPSVAWAYDTLLTFKSGPGVDYNEGVLAPHLAERWESAPDAKAFTFHLKKGVKFAPFPKVEGVNGRELTSSDVKWSYEYGSRTGQFQGMPPSEYGFMFEGLDRVDTPDPYTVVVRFKEPFAPFPNYAAANWNAIMPKEIHEQDGHLKDRIVGTGPFQFDLEGSQKGTRWLLKRNPDYWDAGKPHIDQLRYLVIPDDSAMIAAFNTKQVDLLDALLPPEHADQISKGAPDAVVYTIEAGYPWAFYINQTKPPFNDERVRRALSLSLDRDEMIRIFQKGKGIPQLPAVFTGYFTEQEVRELQPYDPERAKRQLAEAGYPNGLEFEWTFSRTTGDWYEAVLQLIQAQAKKTGFTINLKPLDQQVFSGNLRILNHVISLQPGSSRRWDIDLSFADWHPNARVNYHGVKDPKLGGLIDAQRAASDPAKRREVIREMVKYMMEKQYGIGLYTQVRYNAWYPYIKNYQPNWNLLVPPLEEAWLEK